MAVLGLVVVLAVDVFRIGFFADDFHFLDIARRVPWWAAIDGRFGLYPWFRPLSRELYFAVVAASGPAGLVVAHGLSLGCVLWCAWQIRAVGLRLLGPRSAAIAPVLFLTYGMTKFLAAWASGFQDLLALLLSLSAIKAQIDGRFRRAAVWAFLGLFAKETAVVVFPILVAYGLLLGPAGRRRSWIVAHNAALAAGVAIHVIVRTTWSGHGVVPHVEGSWPAVAAALVRTVTGFVGGTPVREPGPLLLAGLAAVAALVLVLPALLKDAPRDDPHRDDRAGLSGPTVAFLASATVLGTLPLVLGVGRVSPHDYYAFSAAPWSALLLASAIARLPRAAVMIVVASMAAWNTSALGYRRVDLQSPRAWEFRRWDWPEALRLSAVAKRLQNDLRQQVALRPDSLVILLSGMSNGCFFQTEDGPAARESLHDSTVRAFWLYAPPFGLEPGHFEILSFNQASKHLERHALPLEVRKRLAAVALAAGEAPATWALASYGDAVDNSTFALAYARAAAALMVGGIAGARPVLARLGVPDSDRAAARLAEAEVGRASPLYDPMVHMLRSPFEPGTHLTLGRALWSGRHWIPAAVELRIAATLDPSLFRERLTLALLMTRMGQPDAARRDLQALAADAAGTPLGDEARDFLASTTHASVHARR